MPKGLGAKMFYCSNGIHMSGIWNGSDEGALVGQKGPEGVGKAMAICQGAGVVHMGSNWV